MSAGVRRRASWCAAVIGGTVTLYALGMSVVLTVWQHQIEDWQEALEHTITWWDEHHPTTTT